MVKKVYLKVSQSRGIRRRIMLNKIKAEYQQVEEEFQREMAKLSDWRRRFNQLEEDIIQLNKNFEHQYEKKNIQTDLPISIQELLENRREGIRLSVKTTGRLLRKLTPLLQFEFNESRFMMLEQVKVRTNGQIEDGECEAEEVIEKNQEDPLSESGAPKLEEADELKKSVEESKLIDEERRLEIYEEATLKDGDNDDQHLILLQKQLSDNHQALIELKEMNHKVEKRFFTFMEKSLAPIMDGLYSGKKHAKNVEKEINEEHEETREKVNHWLEIYSDLIHLIETVFDSCSINLLTPTIAEPFNENLHEPIAVIEDPSFRNEQIKEVVRLGLVYHPQSFLIRPAQVIVVKNVEQKMSDDVTTEMNEVNH